MQLPALLPRGQSPNEGFLPRNRHSNAAVTRGFARPQGLLQKSCFGLIPPPLTLSSWGSVHCLTAAGLSQDLQQQQSHPYKCITKQLPPSHGLALLSPLIYLLGIWGCFLSFAKSKGKSHTPPPRSARCSAEHRESE